VSQAACLHQSFSFQLHTCYALFLAVLTMPRHFSFTSMAVLLQTQSEFTRSVKLISSQTFVLLWFDRVDENLLFITSRCCSAASNSKVHSAAVKFGFFARFGGEGSTFSAILLLFPKQHVRAATVT